MPERFQKTGLSESESSKVKLARSSEMTTSCKQKSAVAQESMSSHERNALISSCENAKPLHQSWESASDIATVQAKDVYVHARPDTAEERHSARRSDT